MDSQDSKIRELIDQHFARTVLTTEVSEFMRGFGYDSLDLPIIHPSEQFLVKAGDQLIEHLFTFERQGQQFALRPEFTAPAAYLYSSKLLDQRVARWQFAGPVFEDHLSLLADHYQKMSIGAELIGMSGPLADAEIVAMCIKALHNVGLVNCRVHIGHTGITRQILRDFGLDERIQQFLLHRIASPSMPDRGKEWVREELDHILHVPSTTLEDGQIEELPSQMNLNSPLGSRKQEDIVRRINRRKQQSDQYDRIISVLNILEELGQITGSTQNAFADIQRVRERYTLSDEVQSILNSWQFTISLIEAYGISNEKLTISPNMALSWEYYTGIVFRVMAASNSIAGGGRYDEFIRLFGGKADVPAVGFALDIDAIVRSQQTQDRTTKYVERITVHVTIGCEPQAIHIVQSLRDNGIAACLADFSDAPVDSGTIIVESSGIRRNNQVYAYDAVDQVIADIRRT